MLGSVAVLLLIVLNVSGRLSFNSHGPPRHIGSSHRKAAEVEFMSEKAADELGVVLETAKQIDGDTALAADGSRIGTIEHDTESPKLRILEEEDDAVVSADSGQSSISLNAHEQAHLAAAEAADVHGNSQLSDLSQKRTTDDNTLRQELLQQNLNRPQVTSETNAYDGSWAQRNRIITPSPHRDALEQEKQEGTIQQAEHMSWLERHMPASHLKPAGSIKRFLSGNEDTPLQHQPNCPASFDIAKLEELPFCHKDLALPLHADIDLHGTSGVTSNRDNTAHGLPRAQVRARVRKSQAGITSEHDGEPDVCGPLLGVKKVALLFLTRGELYHAKLWGTWLEAASGDPCCLLVGVDTNVGFCTAGI